MAENSEPPERVHLFSVSASIRTAAAMVGSLLAGALPALALTLADTIAASRATQVGIEGAVASILLAAGGFLGARMMAGGDFQTPFLNMAACYLASTLLFFTFFRGLDRPSAETEPFSA